MKADPSHQVVVSGVRFSIDCSTGDEDAVVWRRVDPQRTPVPYLFEVTDRSCEVRIESTTMMLERGDPHSVRIDSASALADQGLIHPYLSLPAAVIQHWNGRVVLHASAFDLDGRTVVLLGDREAGKSTTVAAARAAGFAVRADDVVVLDGTDALPGTSLIDLREPAATIYGGQALGRVGSRERWRIHLDPVATSAPVAAFVRLSWGASVDVTPLPQSALLQGLYASAAIRETIAQHIGSRPSLMMDLLGIPYYEFQRPRDLSLLGGAVASLCDQVGRGR
jgi:hypothetical protein